MKFSDPLNGEYLEIRGVYYDKDYKPASYYKRHVGISGLPGETIDDLRSVLRRMEEALDKRILTPKDFKNSETQ